MLDYRKDIGLVTVKDENLIVGSLLQSDKPQRGARNAYAMARFSRKPLDVSLVSILEDLEDRDSKKRIENIVHNYGHASVADLAAGQFVFIEGLSILDTLRFHYSNYFYASQESSTRYITVDTKDIEDVKKNIKIPLILKSKADERIIEEYTTICKEYFYKYNSFINRFKEVLGSYYEVEEASKILHSRSLDCARYFLPLATKVGLGITMSARKWSGELKRLLRSPYQDDNNLYLLLNKLLVEGDEEVKDYIPEADLLLRHIDDSDINLELIKLCKDRLNSPLNKIDLYDNNIKESIDINIINTKPIRLLDRLIGINNPYSFIDKQIKFKTKDLEVIAEFINNKFSRYEELPRGLFSSSKTSLSGYTDIGSFKDLNRHRSTFRYCPVLEDYSVLYYDLLHNYDYESLIAIPPYIDYILEDKNINNELREKVIKVKEDYLSSMSLILSKALNFFYRLIRDSKLNLHESSYVISHLLPHGFIIPYSFSLDLSSLMYIEDLRTRAGAHISYSLEVRNWLEALLKEENILEDELEIELIKGLKSKLDKECPYSRDMFIGRS